MRVLHVWNTAGVASVLAKYLRKLYGLKVWVIMRKDYDPFGLTTFGEAVECKSMEFYVKLLSLIKNYDIIHVHSLDKLVPIIKLLYPRKSVVLHYHGGEIRGKWCNKKAFWMLADLVLVSTPDLLDGAPSHVIYLPNPVDIELFKPIPKLRRYGTALYFFDPYNSALSKDYKWAINIARRYGLKLKIHNRRKYPIPHTKLCLYLNRFEYLIDKHTIPSLSKTGLEALACGLKVVRWDGKIVKGLPEEHKAENVVRNLVKLYKEVYKE